MGPKTEGVKALLIILEDGPEGFPRPAEAGKEFGGNSRGQFMGIEQELAFGIKNGESELDLIQRGERAAPQKFEIGVG